MKDLNDYMQLFSAYMDDWLYGQNGYYANYHAIGKEGDFFTAVSTSKFFGGAIAKDIIRCIDEGLLAPQTTILEIGAHAGYLLADIIEFINTLRPDLIKSLHFAIFEKVEKLQVVQKEYFDDAFGDAISLTHFDSKNPPFLKEAFIIANEIFDAFACELVMYKNGTPLIAKVDQHKIVWGNCDDLKILAAMEKYQIKKGEISVGFDLFADFLATHIEKFEFVSFDYGERYPRNDFSIRVYKNHITHPLFEEGLNLAQYIYQSDITYDVHFDLLIAAFKQYNIDCVDYTTQLKALIEMGILELLEVLLDHCEQQVYIHELNKIKTLLDPAFMGERFKMVRFRKGA